MYRLNDQVKHTARRRIVFWWSFFIVLGCLITGGIYWAHTNLRPDTMISRSTSVTTHISYTSPTKNYSEADFSIQLPTSWQMVPRAVGPYDSYTWRSSDGEQIVIYEDTIPSNLAVNRVLVVQPADTQLELDGTTSANCTTFTNNAPLPNQTGAPAEWNGVSFLCDKVNPERDVVGTSSVDGVNTVTLKDPNSGAVHKFFFTYTDESINPDYTVFYNALESFRLN